MKIVANLREYIKDPNKLSKDNPKDILITATALAALGILSAIFYPVFTPLIGASTFLFLMSAYLTFKVVKNMDPLIYYILDKSINDEPFDKGYYEGRLMIGYMKGMHLRPIGFLKGCYHEIMGK